MVSQIIIISIIIAMILCILLPVMTLLYFKRKEHISFKSVFIGVLGFVFFSMILERLLHTIVISTKIIDINSFYFAIYAALAAGIFEEVGRFVMFKTFLKKTIDWKDGFGYGIGHGGIETILVGALSFLNSLIIALSINSGKLDTLLKGQNASTIDAVKNSVTNASVQIITLGVFERICAFIIQLALTFVVLYGIRKRKILYLLAAILLHSLVDFVPALYQTKYITSLYLTECVVFIFALLSLVFVIKTKPLFKNLH